MRLSARSRARTAATAVLVGSAVLAAVAPAQAATTGTTTYLANTGPGECVAQLNFHRSADALNTAQAVIVMAAAPPQVNSCVGALWESADAGRTWHQVSGTHTVHANWSPAVYSATTGWYSDGVTLLARACVHEHYARADTDSAQVCTSAH